MQFEKIDIFQDLSPLQSGPLHSIHVFGIGEIIVKNTKARHAHYRENALQTQF